MYKQIKLFINQIVSHARNVIRDPKLNYHNMVEHSIMGIYVIQDNLFKYVNERWCEIHGYTFEEAVNKMGPYDTVYEEDKEIVRENIRRRIAGEISSLGYEFRIVRKDKKVIWVRVLGYQTIYNNKPAVAGTSIECTEQKLLEEALKNSERRLRTLFETIPDLVWVKNLKGEYLNCNPRFEKLFGASEKEIIGKTDYHFLDNDSASKIQQSDLEVIETNKTIINERELTFSDGHQEILETIKTPLFEENGTFIGVLGIGRDITNRKKAEAEIKESEELFKILLKFAPYPIILTDLNNHIILYNDAYIYINNIENTDIIGKTTEELGYIFEPSDSEFISSEMNSNGKVENFELTVTMRIGEKKDFLYSSQIIKWKNKPMIIHSYIDITEKKKYERELERYHEHLELLVQERTDELEASLEELNAINEELYRQKEVLQNSLDKLNAARKQLIQSEKMASLGTLSAGIAHEINNPLNFIHGGCYALESFLEENLKDNMEDAKPFINAINEGVKRASEIVSSLSRYSRQNDLPTTACDIHLIINNCLIMMQNQLKGRVIVNKHFTEKKHTVWGNEGKLHQAFLNILTNAAQAIEKDGYIDITTEVVNHQLLVKIKDSGHGMKPETLEKIFDPFFTTKPPGKGTGLGLSITFNIIQELNGSIEYESTFGEGAQAIITLPIIN